MRFGSASDRPNQFALAAEEGVASQSVMRTEKAAGAPPPGVV
jgi:hypothetical protein